jgi:adenine-specific DNA-methyltransferase
MIQKEPVNKEAAAIVPEQIEQLRDLFPQAFTEGKIDFDKLKETLGEEVDSRPERYSFSWAGKRDAIRLLQTPSRATLVPAKKESINFDETNNIFIEGDNLEVLKMIYIDPP